ncbi:PPR21-like protein [Mya arenaria]|uniref:Protein phosphatase 1 regulatory subunit 21 n=1 Tax=Mya arenaria TaxID=6604 RepID=A0ABY7G468_MYAAR|nr:PPR21-like protein [Mya arenaria]
MSNSEEKYKKLAAEYAKLKSQVPVLKKAYLDEQSSHNDLKSSLKECEQTVRKYEQEVDSLTFRNQQLSTRCSLLQEELDALESKKKHKVHDIELEYKSQLESLQQKLEQFERQCSEHELVLNSTVQKNQAHIDKLQEEKAMLEVKLQSMDADMRDFKTRTVKAESQLGSIESELKDKLNLANKIIADKLPFIDTRVRELNGLNLPTHDRRHQLRSRELVNQSATLLGEVIQALSNFYTYTEQRSQIYPADGKAEPISPVNVQFCKLLHEHLSYLRPVEQSLKDFLVTFKDDALTTLEECAVSSCTSMLHNKNMELHRSLKKLNAIFNKLDTVTSLLAAQSTKTCGHSPSNHPRMFALLCDDLVQLHGTMPTATQRLKTTDECVVSSLVSLVTSTGKFSTFLSGNREFFSQRAGYRTRGSSMSGDYVNQSVRSNPAIVTFRQRAAHYISSLSRPCPESVPHHIAVQNRKVLLSSTESKEGLAKQIEAFQQRVGRLEQEKEHWMLEHQLLKIKFEHEEEKTRKLEKEMENSTQVEQVTSIQDNVEAPRPLGKLDATGKPTGNVDTREALIKNHFSVRINDLTQQVQLADSKCVSFHAEMAERAKKQSEDELKAMSQTYAQLKDELSTTSKNYESQLSMMSDHLAGMNEKLTQQKDEIDDLKTQIAKVNTKSSSSSPASKQNIRTEH